MRETVHRQLPLTPGLREHEHVRELQAIGEILERNQQIGELVHADLVRDVREDIGSRANLSADQVVRAAILYQSNGWSFAELEFELCFHAAYRDFCRLGLTQYPSKSSLHRDISRIRAETWEQISRVVIGYAHEIGVEDGAKSTRSCATSAPGLKASSRS